MKPQLILISLVLATISGVTQTTQKPVWDLTLRPNQQASSTLTVVNQCQKTHSFRVTGEDAPFVRFPAQRDVKVGGRKSEVLPIIFDTRSLTVGTYQGRVVVACSDCQTEPTCTQDREVLQVTVTITKPGNGATTPPWTAPTPTPAVSPLIGQPSPATLPRETVATPSPVPLPQPSPLTGPPSSPADKNCCERLREQNGGKITFQQGDKGIELSGNKLIMRSGNKTVTWNLGFDIEKDFCKLDDFRIQSQFSQLLESKASGGQTQERGSSVSVLLSGPDRDNRTARPHFFFQFQASYLDANGESREYSATLSLDEKECTWQLQLLKDDVVTELQTYPPRAAKELSVLVGTHPAHRHFLPYQYGEWWDAFFSLLMEINRWDQWLKQHPNATDRGYVDEAFSRWRLNVTEAVKAIASKGEGLTAGDRQMLRNMLDLLEQRQLTQEVIKQFVQLHNEFRDGVRLRP